VYANSRKNLPLYRTNPVKFLRRYASVDETWAHHFHPEKKTGGMEIHHSH